MGLFDIFKSSAAVKERPPRKIVSGESIAEIFRKLGVGDVTAVDGNYLALPERELRDFVFKHHSNFQDPYYKKEVFDCDDFAYLAKADIIRGQVKDKYEQPVIFGRISYMPRNGGRFHMANFSVTDDDRVLIYDPQKSKWMRLEDEAKEVRRVEF